MWVDVYVLCNRRSYKLWFRHSQLYIIHVILRRKYFELKRLIDWLINWLSVFAARDDYGQDPQGEREAGERQVQNPQRSPER